MRLRRRRLDRGRRLLKHDDRIALPAAPWNVNLRRRRRLHRQRRPRRRRIFLAHLTSLLLSHRQLTLNRRLSLTRIHKHRMAHGNLRSPRDREHPTKHRARAERPPRARSASRLLQPRPPSQTPHLVQTSPSRSNYTSHYSRFHRSASCTFLANTGVPAPKTASPRRTSRDRSHRTPRPRTPSRPPPASRRTPSTRARRPTDRRARPTARGRRTRSARALRTRSFRRRPRSTPTSPAAPSARSSSSRPRRTTSPPRRAIARARRARRARRVVRGVP